MALQPAALTLERSPREPEFPTQFLTLYLTMDTRSTTRARTGSNRGTVQTTNNTESGTEVNEPLSNAANAAENGADNTRANNDMDRENRDPGITDESIDDGLVHNDTRNTTTNRANTASEEHAADGEQGENDVIAQTEARVWSDHRS